jgi:pilus assembly protein CpaB
MDKRMVNLIIGIILALVAIAMIHNYITEQRRRIERLIEEGKLVNVVVARKDISKETTITSDMVDMETVNRNTFQPGDLSSLASVIGQFAEVDILKGQHINSNMVRSLGAAQYLSQTVPVGMRAMTIPVDKISAVEGLIKPGDHVDIVATFAVPGAGGGTTPVVITVFQGVKILATDRNISQYRISKAAGTITLALAPEDVKNLTYILEWGQVKLVLRAPLDTTQDYGYAAVTFETLMKKLGMWHPAPPQMKPETIDVFKGAEREEMPISQQ